MKRVLKLKDFGHDRELSSVEELKETLIRDYQGQSVSIVYATRPHGMLRTVFVDVSADGTVTESYGAQRPVDFEAIEAHV